MWDNFLFDSEGVFQWASIAAIVSALALITSIINIYVSISQGKKNRAVNSIVSTKIEFLKTTNKIFHEICSGLSDHHMYLSKDSSRKEDPELFDKAVNSKEVILKQIMQLQTYLDPDNIHEDLLLRAVTEFVASNMRLLTKYNNYEKIAESEKNTAEYLMYSTDCLRKYNNYEWKVIDKLIS